MKKTGTEAVEKTVLQLYVTGMSQNSMEAIQKIRNFCDQYLTGTFKLDIIDLYKHPEAAAQHQIVFSPSLIRVSPLPKKIMIGNLTDTDKIIRTLGLEIPK